MHPTFQLGPLDFPAYFTFLTLGYLLAVMLAWRESFKTTGVDPNKLLDLSIVMLIAGVLGARLLHVVADGSLNDYVNFCVDPMQIKGMSLPGKVPCVSDQQCLGAQVGGVCNVVTGLCHPERDCLRWLKFWYGGLAFYGGLFLATGVGVWYIRRNRERIDFWRMADLAGFAIPLGLIFGRVGCLLGGCCFGAETDSEWFYLIFPKGSPAWDRHHELHPHMRLFESLPVVPTQIVQIITNSIMFGVCYWLFKRRKKYDGQVFVWFMALYAIFRFTVEFWRDDHRGVWLGETLSTSQLLALPALAAAGIMAWWLRRRAATLNGVAASAATGAESTSPGSGKPMVNTGEQDRSGGGEAVS